MTDYRSSRPRRIPVELLTPVLRPPAENLAVGIMFEQAAIRARQDDLLARLETLQRENAATAQDMRDMGGQVCSRMRDALNLIDQGDVQGARAVLRGQIVILEQRVIGVVKQ